MRQWLAAGTAILIASSITLWIGLRWYLLVVGLICLVYLFVAALARAAGDSDRAIQRMVREHAANESPKATEISDRLVRDFDVVRDEFGVEHIVPVPDAPSPGA